jgi:hypothetical protein
MTKKDYTKPVAYDTEGRPLYLHPPEETQKLDDGITAHDEVAVVQVTRTSDPVAVSVSPEMQARNEESKKKYPFLNLSAGEYVVLEVKRTIFAPIVIVLATTTAVCLTALIWWYVMVHPGSQVPIVNPEAASSVSMFALGMAVLLSIFGWVAYIVFYGNKFFLTNESVIQEIQTALLAQKEQTINLENIKDASFTQRGIVPTLLNYGVLHLSTEGDEQEYRFSYVNNPKQQIAIINNVIEAVKYGRPIDDAVDSAVHSR